MKTFSVLEVSVQTKIVKRVIGLSWTGLGYKRIIKKVKEEFAVSLSLGLLSYWFNHEVKLYGGQNHFSTKPTGELAYVLGVMFGDGNIFLYESKKDYAIRLEAIDKDFVEYFSKCISKVLNKERDYAVVKYKQKAMNSFMYSARARSKELYYFIKELKEDFEKVKPFAKAYPKEFIQGLADSEGCPVISAGKQFSVKVLVAVSTNLILLEFVKKLLNKFSIHSVVFLSKKEGASDSVINGRVITRTKNLYALQISNLGHVKKFSKEINFTIGRKKVKLADGIFTLCDCSILNPVAFWKINYEKRSNQWFHRKTIWTS